MKKTQRKNSREFFCETCKKETIFSYESMKEHLLTVHKITEMKGMREMLLHIDGTDFYQSNYKWTFGDVVVTEVTVNKRTGMNKALWAAE